MVNQRSKSNRSRPFAPDDAEMERWHEIVRSAPDVRLDRVLATREALRNNRYDDAAILDYTVQCVGNDLGIMLRGEWVDGDAEQ